MLYLHLFFAGFIYIITPGPVFLAIITLVSEQGRIAGFKLVSGAIFGCMLWLFLTCLFFIESNSLPPWFFTALALACSSYLFFLAYKMFIRGKDGFKNNVFQKPFRDGLIMGILNPKSYPVMVSVFSALVFNNIAHMRWPDFPAIFLFATLGFASGYTVMVTTAGFSNIKAFYTNNITKLSYCFAGIFIYFGILLIKEAVT